MLWLDKNPQEVEKAYYRQRCLNKKILLRQIKCISECNLPTVVRSLSSRDEQTGKIEREMPYTFSWCKYNKRNFIHFGSN
jgi:hypothetical protein